MDYRFTAILIIMLTLLALFGGPAHSRNEYLKMALILVALVISAYQSNKEIQSTVIGILIPIIIILVLLMISR